MKSTKRIGLLTKQQEMAIEFRISGWTFEEIGSALLLTPTRARQLYVEASKTAEMKGDWRAGMTNHLAQIIANFDIQNREELLDAFDSGKIFKGRGMGDKTKLELCAFLGKQPPEGLIKPRRRCPHCGKEL